jgi:hypothetical protein
MMREAGFSNARFEEPLLGTMGINVGETPERESGMGNGESPGDS